MRKDLDENDCINSIRLELRHPNAKNRIWVLVEGDTDQRLYNKLLDGVEVNVEIVHGGLESLRKAMCQLVDETDRVIGIRDADFLHIDSQTEAIDRLFLTDKHDAEMMIVACDHAFRALVSEFIPKKIQDIMPLRSELIQSLVFLGKLRWINNRENLEFNFKGLGLREFYDGELKTLDVKKCLDILHGRSPNKKENLELKKVDSVLADCRDFFNLCNGHDFEKAFAIYVNTCFSKRKGIKDTHVGQALRISYRIDDFRETNLYSQLKEWENKTDFRLFDEN